MDQRAVLVLIALATMTDQAAHARPKPKPATAHVITPAQHNLSEQDKQHLLHDDFAIVKTVREIPEPVRKQLIPDGKDILKGKDILSGMADAGQPFQMTDVVGPKLLPFQRLIFAATSQGYCLVYYEFGGYGTGQRVVLFHLSGGQAARAWSGSLTGSHPPLILSGLRTEISRGKYYDLRD